MNKQTNLKQELETNGSIVYTTMGVSMRPFIRSQEDMVIINAKGRERFRKYDAVLYRRKSGKYVLHRIVKVCPDSYVLCGDNCWQREPGITNDQILGVLTAVIRKGQRLDVETASYRRRVRLWCALYLPRAVIFWLRDHLAQLKRKLIK